MRLPNRTAVLLFPLLVAAFILTPQFAGTAINAASAPASVPKPADLTVAVSGASATGVVDEAPSNAAALTVESSGATTTVAAPAPRTVTEPAPTIEDGRVPDWRISGDGQDSGTGASGGALDLESFVSGATGSVVVGGGSSSPSQPAPAPSQPAPVQPAPGQPAPALAGAVAIGKTAYSVPAGAVHVVPEGSATSGTGTAAAPIAGAQRAINAAASGSTLVLHAGSYRESLAVPFNKKLTIQSAPNEAVWLDGSRPVTGWVASGSAWAAPWTTFFDSKVSFSAGEDETNWWVNPAYPMAGHPDQVWVGGAPLTQVGSRAAVKAGTFYVDQAAKQLVIGTNPSGARVEASALAKALKIQGAGTTVRGIGVQRYATTMALMGAVSAEVNDITLENMVIRDNATVGLYVWNDNKTLRNLTVTGNGLLGIGVNASKNLQVLNSVVSGNNSSRFNHAPVAGGLKASRSSGVVISNSVFAKNVASTGLWFDISSSNVRVTHSVFQENGREGLEVELSQGAILAGNHFIRNGNNGVFILDSGDVDVWNNTFVGNQKTITYMQDERRQTTASLASTIPWITSDIVVRNNVMSYGAGPCPVLTQDLTNRWYGKDFGVSQDANLYHRASSTAPANFACWAEGPKGTRGFTTIDAFRTHTSGDGRSVLREGAAVVDSSSRLTAANPVSTYPLPAAIASAMGVAVQTPTVGALLAPAAAR